ncbi:MAG: hypothetical protein WBH77_09750 [Saccharofermentanales bacterium]
MARILIEPDDIIACICEGNSESALINKLLDSDSLIFTREQLINNELLVNYSAMDFQRKHLNMVYDKKIKIFLVFDRPTWGKIKSPYNEQIAQQIFIITAPEIEMLMIHAENLFNEYKKQKLKPSEFLATRWKKRIPAIKSYNFIMKYYKDKDLINAILEYKRCKKFSKNEFCLADLLKLELAE